MYRTFATPYKKGRLAQLVQSISFTPRGSGVRIPHCPQKTQKVLVTKSFKDFFILLC